MSGPNNVGFLKGDSAQYDHHMWPRMTRADLVAQFARFGLSGEADKYYKSPIQGLQPEQMNAIAWRVRKWQWNAASCICAVNDINVGASQPGPPVQSSTYQIHNIANPATSPFYPYANLVHQSLDNPYRMGFPGPLTTVTTQENQLIDLFGPTLPTVGGQIKQVNLRHYEMSNDRFPAYREEVHFPGILDSGSYDTTSTWGGWLFRFGRYDRPYGVVVTENVSIPADPPGPPPTVEQRSYPYIEFFRSYSGSGLNIITSTYEITGLSYVSSQVGKLIVKPVIAPDFEVPLWLSGYYQGNGVASPNNIDTSFSFVPTSQEFVIEAKEFWPFQNSLGLPVYDTATGLQINDPFA